MAVETHPDGWSRTDRILAGVFLLLTGILLWPGRDSRFVLDGDDPRFDRAKAKADIAAIAIAVREFSAWRGRLPVSLAELLLPDETGWAPIDRSQVPRDPWGHEYRHERCDVPPGFHVFSLGSDGRPGGTRDDADVDSLEFLAR